MRILEMPRRSGKTTRLLQWLARDSRAVLIVASTDRAEKTWDMAEEMGMTLQRDEDGKITREGIERRQILTTYHMRGSRGSYTKVAVDDADHVLYDIFGAPVEILSFTGDRGMSVSDFPVLAEKGTFIGDDSQTIERFVATGEKTEPLNIEDM